MLGLGCGEGKGRGRERCGCVGNMLECRRRVGGGVGKCVKV